MSRGLLRDLEMVPVSESTLPGLVKKIKKPSVMNMSLESLCSGEKRENGNVP